MNQQEVNTALYNKLAAEQAEYRKWLLTQPPEEIVGRAYEYTLREDILTAAEQLELSKAQALELLAANSPMEAICQQFRSLGVGSENLILDCAADWANAALQSKREAAVYPYPSSYAREHGELEQYRASKNLDVACRDAIEDAIAENYWNSRIDREAVAEVSERFGYDRMFRVLSNTIRIMDHDGRISAENKRWAKTVPIFENPDSWGQDRNLDFVLQRAHPGLIDLFTSMARHEHLLTLPLSKEDIQKEAARILSRLQAEREPNSPDGTHFMAQISPDFLARAKTRDQNRLMAMLPFSSHSLSTVAGRVGVFVLISKDENRSQPLCRRKPSVREKLSEKPPASPVKKAPSKDREAR